MVFCDESSRQAWHRVERHFRDGDGAWQREELTGEGRMPIPCPETSLTLDEIYESLARSPCVSWKPSDLASSPARRR